MVFPHRVAERQRQRRRGPWLLRWLVALGVLALLYFYSWWSVGGRIGSFWLAVALVLAILYGSVQFLGNWLLYLAARHRFAPGPPPDGLTVDVFVTVCREPYALIERALTATVHMRGEHRTWLLDDGADPALARLARQLGAGYLTRPDRKHAKAGNINTALARTSGDLVVIFDVDHAPEPDFLERTLGHFRDSKVGFVQVMLTFGNGEETWVARSAVETGLDFYNPTSLGMDAVGSATMMGSNALIRRAALASIGGYQSGLAEDLATSIALHAAGWRSAYVAEPLAPGLAPRDLAAWFTQQLKWARGVFEVLLTIYPRLFGRLTWGQRLAYAVRMTYYWAGPFVFAHILLTLAILFGGSAPARASFQQYLAHLFPVGVFALLIRQAALRIWRHPSVQAGLLGKPVTLIYATWPIYTVAWLMALLRVPWGFRSTPKDPTGALNPFWLLPQVMAVVLLGNGVVYAFIAAEQRLLPMILLFAVMQVVPQVVLLSQWLYSARAVATATSHSQPRLQFPERPATLSNYPGEHQHHNGYGGISLLDQPAAPGTDGPMAE
ncbi:MAG: glycosyltransferase [Ardenticatenaceae bacterium]|nr:glycosyltransferase [Ardenticatenaceae bacterium]